MEKVQNIDGVPNQDQEQNVELIKDEHIKAKQLAQNKRVNTRAKLYTKKPSLGTILFNTPNFKVIYNLVISLFVVLLTSTILENFILHHEINLGLRAFLFGFGKFSYVIPIWISLFLLSLLIYPAFNLWAKFHCKILEISPQYNRHFNLFSLYLLILYYIAIFALPTFGIFYCDLPPLSSFVILVEEIRIVMKIHSYVRNNTPIVLNFKPKEDYPLLPDFDKFLYFQFAPTFIYMDGYPRTKSIDWNFVIKRFCELSFLIYLLSVIFERFAKKFEKTCIEPTTYAEIFLKIYQNSLYGMVCLAGFGYLLLNSWLNAFAEITRFSDRGFYKDWWNTPSYLQYYRLWNDIVQDWLYAYVYKDFLEFISPNKKTLAKIMVFFISAFFHEYALGLSLRIFFPANFFFFFGGSMVMMYLEKDWGNIYFLCTVGWGFSIQISSYALAFYAHQNCPIENPTFWDILTPRVLSCNCIS